jgi:hypothetical protein
MEKYLWSRACSHLLMHTPTALPAPTRPSAANGTILYATCTGRGLLSKLQ